MAPQSGANTLEGQEQVARWLGHAKDYIQQVLAPRCQSLQSEVCVGVNWVTGETEILPTVKDREYPDWPGWMFGTTDLLAILNTGELYVGDWKTGGTDGAKEQLLSLGVAFQRAMLGPEFGDHFRPLVTSCLSVQDHGVVPVETRVSPEEAQNHWDAMRFAWEDIGKQQAGVPGIHCSQLYCPHLAYCSAITRIVSDAATQDGQAPDSTPLVAPGRVMRDFRLTDKPRSQEEAGHVMALVTAANRQTKYLTNVLKDYARSGGRVVSGSWEWKEGAGGFRWGRQK